MAACVGVGVVGMDIRHPLERDRRGLRPLSRTRNSDRVTHWRWKRVITVRSMEIQSLSVSTFHGETRCIIEGPLLFIFLGKVAKPKDTSTPPMTGAAPICLLYHSVASRNRPGTLHVIAASKPPRSSAD